MAQKIKPRFVTHLPMGSFGARAVHYKLQKTAPKARKTGDGEEDRRTAFAKLVERETVTQEQLEGLVHERDPLLRPSTIHYVMEVLTQVLIDQLKQGRRVTFQDKFSFGAAFEGRVDPERPFDVRHLPLAPWVRFSEPFINELNRNVRIAYDGHYLPPRVKVKSVKNMKDLVIEVRGEFRHPEALMADIVLSTGETIPCKMDIPSYTTRPYVESLVLLPTFPSKKKLPLAGAQLHLSWLDGASDPQTLTFDL